MTFTNAIHLYRLNHSRRLGSLLLALSLISVSALPSVLSSMAYAKKQKSTTAERDFLPPVATINASMSMQPKPLNQESPLSDDSSLLDSDLGPVTLSAVASPSLQLSAPIKQVESGLSPAQEHLNAFLKLQHGVDAEDMQHLWNAVVERNPVIRFSLEKLAIPPDIQGKQSSRFVKKTLNVLISGAVMGATMVPGVGGGANSYYQSMGAVTGGDILHNLIEGKRSTNGTALSSTEQIQLAALIDELRSDLVQSYHQYKATLQSLAIAEANAQQTNAAYSKALSAQKPLSVMVSGASYFKARSQHTKLMQKAKTFRLQLERLAGADAVSELALLPQPETEQATEKTTNSPETAAKPTEKSPAAL